MVAFSFLFVYSASQLSVAILSAFPASSAFLLLLGCRGQRLARIRRCTPSFVLSPCASWSTDSCEGRVIYHEAHEEHEGRLRQSSSRTCHRGSLRALVRRCSIMPTRRRTETGCTLTPKLCLRDARKSRTRESSESVAPNEGPKSHDFGYDKRHIQPRMGPHGAANDCGMTSSRS